MPRHYGVRREQSRGESEDFQIVRLEPDRIKSLLLELIFVTAERRAVDQRETRPSNSTRTRERTPACRCDLVVVDALALSFYSLMLRFLLDRRGQCLVVGINHEHRK